MINLVEALDGVEFLDAVITLTGEDIPRKPIERRPDQSSTEDSDRERSIGNARTLWAHHRPIAGTIAEKYLGLTRCLPLDEDLSHCLGFEPASYWREVAGDQASPLLRVPCLLALFRLIDTDEIVAVQKTRLAPEATKVGRRFIGRPGGAAIKIDRDEDVTQGLAISEGVETGLGGRVKDIRPCWAVGSARAIESFPVLAGIDCLTVHREHCPENEKAFCVVRDRWFAAGREVFSAWSDFGKDVNDEIIHEKQNG